MAVDLVLFLFLPTPGHAEKLAFVRVETRILSLLPLCLSVEVLLEYLPWSRLWKWSYGWQYCQQRVVVIGDTT